MDVYKGFFTSLALGLSTRRQLNLDILDAEERLYATDTNISLKNIEVGKAESFFYLDLMGKTINYLGASAGVSTPPERATPLQGALGGASVGAAVGGIPGALVGGLLGYLAA